MDTTLIYTKVGGNFGKENKMNYLKLIWSFVSDGSILSYLTIGLLALNGLSIYTAKKYYDKYTILNNNYTVTLNQLKEDCQAEKDKILKDLTNCNVAMDNLSDYVNQQELIKNKTKKRKSYIRKNSVNGYIDFMDIP